MKDVLRITGIILVCIFFIISIIATLVVIIQISSNEVRVCSISAILTKNQSKAFEDFQKMNKPTYTEVTTNVGNITFHYYKSKGFHYWMTVKE